MILKLISISLILMFSISAFSQDLPVLAKGVSHELAKWRASVYSDIRYKLNLTFEKKAPTLKGTIEVSIKLKPDNGESVPIVLDWRKIKGHEKLSKVSNVLVNGKPAKFEEINEHLVFSEGVKVGENVIKLYFESPILTSGSAITRYVDKEDGSEYIYSLFVPSDASTAFPVFDQPDLKARFTLETLTPVGWQVASNSPRKPIGLKTIPIPPDNFSSKIFVNRVFGETQPISTYVFAFAAGEFERFIEGYDKPISTLLKEDDEKNKEKYAKETKRPTEFYNQITNTKLTNIYVRKSQAEKFKPHAKEIFRLNRESIKFFEEYFDYKFPFPKYDLVLIPEFPFGGMEHAGATFLRESAIIFPTEPTANNYISRASLLLHENAHQWFGDTVTMKWFDDLWLKEGFATFMAYKALGKVLPEYNAWKIFYERTKPRAYATDVTKGTTPIYQKIANLNSAKSAYGNIVYNKAPGFLKQAEFYLGEKEFQTAVRAFLKDNEFSNAHWSDLVGAFEKSSGRDLKTWANVWVKRRGLPIIRLEKSDFRSYPKMGKPHDNAQIYSLTQQNALGEKGIWQMKTNVLLKYQNGSTEIREVNLDMSGRPPKRGFARYWTYLNSNPKFKPNLPILVFPNHRDYGYGIFLLDKKSKTYILENIQNEKDEFLRSMMWGSLWDSVRFSELAPLEYINLSINHATKERDVTTITAILGRVETAFTYYLSETQQKEFAPKLEKILLKGVRSKNRERQITFYRAFLRIASTRKARKTLKGFLRAIDKKSREDAGRLPAIRTLPLRTKDKFDIVSKLIILGDKEAPKLLAQLEKAETSDAARRYAYAAKAGFATKENKSKFWKDFVDNKEIPESWIDDAVEVWNAPSQSALTISYLEKALAELPNLKRDRKIFFINGWLASFIGGQKSEQARLKVDQFLVQNPGLDIDLRRKILERLDGLERAVKIRKKYSK